MQLTIDQLSASAVTVAGDNAVLRFAGDELREHLAGRAGPRQVTLSCGDGPIDGFAVTVAPEEVRIAGVSPRGALNGVYWLLEQLGFCWVEPGADGEAFVEGSDLAEGEYESTPAFPRRTLILGQDALHDDWPAWMEWASRNRYNDIFFHDTPPSIYERRGRQRPADAEALDAERASWMFERWDADGARIVAEAERRGLALQFGGHHLPTLVPRELFDTHPEWFPLRGGKRQRRYNICTASPGLRAYLARSVEAFLDRVRGADIYHFWGDDIRGGGWCECREGCDRSPSDQALYATNLIAETVERVAPGTSVAHLAYHDTLLPPETVRPRENVTLLYAPRERCYAHAITDPACKRNRGEYWEPFERFRSVFRGETRIQVFEYYSDAILFKGLAPTHLTALPGDAASYRAAGVWNMGNLMVGDRPWVGPPWHAWWTARCLWDPGTSAACALAWFTRAAYGEGAAAMTDYYLRSEIAYRQLLDLHDLEPLPRHDVLDYSDQPRGTLTRKATELWDAACTFEDLLSSIPAGQRAERERVQAEFVAALSRHLAERLAAWDTAHVGNRPLTLESLEAAELALKRIAQWDAQHNTLAYAVISHRMRRAMAFHLEETRALLSG